MFIHLNADVMGLREAKFEDLVALAPDCGFGGIDFPVRDVSSVEEARRLRQMVEQAGLRWGLFWLPCDFLRAGDEEAEKGFSKLEEILPLVQAAGCRRAYNHIWPGSDERGYEENFDWHVQRLRRLNGMLKEAGVQLGIEFIGPKTLQDTFRHPFIRSIGEAAKLADAVGPDVGFVIDTFHWYTSGGTLEDLRAALKGRPVVNVHVNDAVAGRSRDEQMDQERALPLETGLIDAAGVLRLLHESGYDGPVMAEPFSPHRERFAAMKLGDALAEIGRSLRRLFEEAGVRNG